jgi:glutaredoxin
MANLEEVLSRNIEYVIGKYDNVVFSLSYCPYCEKAKTLLKGNYWTIDIDKITDEPCREKLSDLLANKYCRKDNKPYTTYPKIFMNGRFIGGCSNLENLLSQ